MAEKLELSLPERAKGSDKSRSVLIPILAVIILIGILANLSFLLFQYHLGSKKRDEGAVLSAEKQKQLALKLENQGLDVASADAWEEYLQKASVDHEEAARVWYRIGRIYQDAHQYDKALGAFYRSESFAKPADISQELGRCIEESLESMGRFAALRHELTARVSGEIGNGSSASGNETNPIVAEIGPQKIRKSDLDRGIEKVIETQISNLAIYLPEDQVNRKKEELLKQYSTDDQRKIFLNQYLIKEMLYRKAMEDGLMDRSEVRSELDNIERDFMAQKVIEKEFANEIKITEGDVRNYYEAHKKDYVSNTGEKENQKSFDEVKNDAAAALRSQKELEVQKKLFSGLKEKYNVVIHNSAFSRDDHNAKTK